MPTVFVSTLLLLLLGGSLQRHAGVPMAAISFVLALLAGVLWFVSLRLHNLLMARRAAQEMDEASASARSAATDAGLRWVTQLTNLAFGMALAAAIPLVEAIAP